MAAANPQRADPTTQLTVSPSGVGGLLAAGTYFASYTFVGQFGESKAGGRSAQFTVTTGQKPQVTLPALPTGVQSMNLYFTPANGVAGTETLYATGITTTSFSADYAAPIDSGGGMPSSNNTGWPGAANTLKVTGRTELVLMSIESTLTAYMSGGAPLPPNVGFVMQRIGHYEAILKAWAAALAEIHTLVAANQPTALTVKAATGSPSKSWTFP